MSDVTSIEEPLSTDLFYESYREETPPDPVKQLRSSHRTAPARIDAFTQMRVEMAIKWATLIERWKHQQKEAFEATKKLAEFYQIKAQAFVLLSATGLTSLAGSYLWLSIPALAIPPAVFGVVSFFVGLIGAKNNYLKSQEIQAQAEQEKFEMQAKIEQGKAQIDHWKTMRAPLERKELSASGA